MVVIVMTPHLQREETRTANIPSAQLPERIGIGLEMIAVVSLRASKVVRFLILFSDVNKITAEN